MKNMCEENTVGENMRVCTGMDVLEVEVTLEFSK